jgi:hypothetical protein
VLLVAANASAQRGARGNPAPGPPHDPRDLSGIWRIGANTNGLDNPPPTFTPAGKTAYDANKPSFGPRAVAPALGNDPLGGANPPGIPRALINHGTKIQFIQLPDKIVQLIEWNRVWREIFTDGRPFPEDPDPAWYGYSIGKWEGNEFVVITTGLDPRSWADPIGLPRSDTAIVEERYHRLDRDNLEMKVTITDPNFYSNRPSRTFRFRLQPSTADAGFIEDIFAPIDEESFNKRVRDPAGVAPGR